MNQLKVAADLGASPSVAIAGSLFLACGASLSAQEIAPVRAHDLEAPTPLRTVDGKIIESRDWSIPTIADIDGDGQKDLVVGQFMNHKVVREGTNGRLGSAGSVRWYRNGARAGAPQYAPGVDLKCDGGLLFAANW